MKKHEKVLNASLTNLAYTLAGGAAISLYFNLWGAAVCLVELTVFSGMFHYKRTDFWRKLDWAGMYIVLTSILLIGIGVGPLYLLLIANIGGFALMVVDLPMRWVVGTLTGLVVAFMLAEGQISETLWATAIGGLAYSNREVGEKHLQEADDVMHGTGWHVPTALMFFIMIKALT